MRLMVLRDVAGNQPPDRSGSTRLVSTIDALQTLARGFEGELELETFGTLTVTNHRYAESIGYEGFYTIEVSEDPAVRVIYSAILGGLA